MTSFKVLLIKSRVAPSTFAAHCHPDSSANLPTSDDSTGTHAAGSGQNQRPTSSSIAGIVAPTHGHIYHQRLSPRRRQRLSLSYAPHNCLGWQISIKMDGGSGIPVKHYAGRRCGARRRSLLSSALPPPSLPFVMHSRSLPASSFSRRSRMNLNRHHEWAVVRADEGPSFSPPTPTPSLPFSVPPPNSAVQSHRAMLVAVACVALVLLLGGGVSLFWYRRHSRAARKRAWEKKYALEKPQSAMRRGARVPEPPTVVVQPPPVAIQSYPQPPAQYAYPNVSMQEERHPIQTRSPSPLSPAHIRGSHASPTSSPISSAPLSPNHLLLPLSPLPPTSPPPPVTPGSPWTTVKRFSDSSHVSFSSTVEMGRGYGWSGSPTSAVVPSLVGIHPFSAMANTTDEELEEEERQDTVMPLPSSASSSRNPNNSSTLAPALSEKAALAALERAREEAAEQQAEDAESSSGSPGRPFSAAPAYREKDAMLAFGTVRNTPGRSGGKAGLMSVASEVTLPVYEP
ncbi:hypothetical protein MIND_00649400 [Mycena indigotica]|uniref:Uncharacterized protein n=1 Tax=Mycena indigotica TaxID=2126181 RepID=A0A8H6W765_9AGAR|nr:uncharacterized protein MIND_00649400 [Mycena indigotica]KAF7304173.1 hypothetical protein MIND_00649400 [Mycena indigotica]